MRIAELASKAVDALERGVVALGERAPSNKQSRALAQPEITETALWAQFSRIGGNLTPSIVSDIIQQADGGNPSRLVDLTHEGRQRDGTMQTVLALRELAVSSLEWSLELPDDAKRKDKKARDALDEHLRNCDTFPLLLAHQVGEGNLFGYAFTEHIWKKVDGQLAPGEFRPINCRRFGYRNEDSSLLFVPEGSSTEDGIDLLQQFPVGKFVATFPRINGDSRVREGYARLLVWLFMFRNWDLRDWLQFGELAWKPWRLGYYQRGANTEDINVLSRAMKSLTASGAALLPDVAKLMVEWPKGATAGIQSTHRELAEWLGQEMARTVVHGTLTVDAGSRGARSLGDVHNDMRLSARQFDGVNAGGFVTRYVCAPFVQYNYGPNTIVPRLALRWQQGMDIEALAKAVSLLAGRIDIPQSWVRRQGGIAEPKPGEQLALPLTPNLPADAIPETDQTNSGDKPEAGHPTP